MPYETESIVDMFSFHRPMSPASNRRWFRFRLRTLFVVVTGLCVWLGLEASRVHKRNAALQRLRPQALLISTVSAERKKAPGERLWIPWSHVREIPFSRRIMGDESIGWIYLKRSAPEEDYILAKSMFPEAEVERLP